MNKNEFIDAFIKTAERKHTVKITSRYQVRRMVDLFLDTICENLGDDGSIKFVGFGEFTVIEHKGHKIRNPQTNGSMDIPAHKTVKFKAGKKLKDSVLKG